MFWRKVPKGIEDLCQISLGLVPVIFLDDGVNFQKLFDDTMLEAFGKIEGTFPKYQEIAENEISRYDNVLAVRCFTTFEEDFYIVTGYEIYYKKNKIGSKWLVKNQNKLRTIKSEPEKMPKLDICYCGCCGDVNTLRQADYVETMYVTF